MAQSQSEQFTPFNLTAAHVARETKKRIEEFVNAQTEQLDKLQEANRLWLDSMQAKANLASEFASKLGSARSIPEALTAYQDWGQRRAEIMAEDTKHILDDTQDLMQMSAQLFAKTWQGQRHGASR